MSGAAKKPGVKIVTREPWDRKDGIDHWTILVTFRDGEPEREFCGVPSCDGSCGFPAAVLPKTEQGCERRMNSSLVACGPLMGWFYRPWMGERFVIGEESREELEKKVWL